MMGLSAKIRISPIGFIIVGLCGLAMIYYFTTDGFYHGHVGETVSMKQLLAAAIELAEKGGNVVRKIRLENNLKEKSKGKTLEGVNDPVTQGDLLSHRAMYYGFQKAFPSIEVVSEEHDNHHDPANIPSPSFTTATVMLNKALHNLDDEYVPAHNVLVWIDPLDATKEYTENLLQYVTTMVCIVVDGKPVAGVIHKPFLKKTYWAWKGHGNSPDIKIPKAASTFDITSPRIIVSRSHAGKVNATTRKAFGEKTKIIPAGGAGYKVLSLFQGEADAYIHVTKIKKWDICAGDAILRAMGGQMSTLKGNEIHYTDSKQHANNDGLLATLYRHKEFRKRLTL